jgi:hypothetical protein
MTDAIHPAPAEFADEQLATDPILKASVNGTRR